ncbi:MAG: hypothetical protein SOR73_02445 [Romboutsia timonensis]|uniref:hypothetical protein n=1 Tax=Romboutsia timonensis TaxID=1776391 RepID=UPI002A758BAE|nr:hypothetical protein [Romboutsia timonensis]MCI6667039.1 hypothetical protein [Romboutsia timonensis]MDY3000505.1 hypothetical protein [Romboutsia timonensis]
MRFKFLDWYTQALGATFGILACIYAYLNGYMFVYGNIEGYFDFLGFSGVISSYLLLPLCLLSLFISLIRSYTIKKEILNMSFESINIFISILTVVVGFMGAKIYFTIPAAFILFHILEPYLHNYRNSENQEVILDDNKEYDITQNTIEFDKIDIDMSSEANASNEAEELYKSRSNNPDVIETKKEIALELLRKHSSKQFIVELTGFTLDEIDMLEKESGINNI